MSTEDDKRTKELELMAKAAILGIEKIANVLNGNFRSIIPILSQEEASEVGTCIYEAVSLLDKWDEYCQKYGSLTGNSIFKKK